MVFLRKHAALGEILEPLKPDTTNQGLLAVSARTPSPCTVPGNAGIAPLSKNSKIWRSPKFTNMAQGFVMARSCPALPSLGARQEVNRWKKTTKRMASCSTYLAAFSGSNSRVF